MLRVIGPMSALLACGVLAVACHDSSSTTRASEATSVHPVRVDQSTVFFPATIDDYGVDLKPADRDHLTELYALRQIDPCGFVDQQTLAANNRQNFSYNYAAVASIEPYGFGPLRPQGGDACTIGFPSTPTGLSLRVLPGEPRWNDAQFGPDAAHPGVAKSTASGCTFHVVLPLRGLAGAPKSMRDPVVEVTQSNVAGDGPASDDASLCPLTEALAGALPERLRDKGIPVYPDRNSVAARFLTSDPCAAAADLSAIGFVWKEPRPDAQWPTTWRHPGVCNLQLTQDGGGAGTAAVVKNALVAWSDSAVSSPAGDTPNRSERDGVALFDFTSNDESGCRTLVVAKSNVTVEPVKVGVGAPELSSPTPVVTVKLSTPASRDCVDVAQHAALAAVKRAT